jgi:hypothetical protein
MDRRHANPDEAEPWQGASRADRHATTALTDEQVRLAAVGAAVVAAALGVLAGVVPAWPGAIHLVALPPLDLVADARWLLTHAPSWPTFLAYGLLVTARTALLAVLLGGRQPAVRRALAFQAVAVPGALVVAQLDAISHAVLYSRIYGVALALAALHLLVLGPAPWSGAPTVAAGVRRAARLAFRLDVLVPYTLLLLLLGSLVERVGEVAIVPGIVASGGLTLAAVHQLRRRPQVRPALAAALAATLLVAATAATLSTRQQPWEGPGAGRDGTLVLMSGINSRSGEGTIFTMEPWRLGFSCGQTVHYSYAGPGDGQPQGSATCPKLSGAPYGPEDTQRPFEEQVELVVEQVADLEQPVTIVAHSQAAWVVWQAGADGDLPPDTLLVLVGVFPASPLAYPPPDEDGTGRVAGDLLRLVAPVADLVDFDFEVDAPLSRELLASPDAASEVLAQPLPDDVAALAITASSDVPLMPDGWRVDGADDVCPVRSAHPYLPVAGPTYAAIDRALDGTPPPSCPPWAELYRQLTQAIGVPPVRS